MMKLIALTFSLVFSFFVNAETIINLAQHDDGEFSRFHYPEMVIKLALDKTIKTHGTYKINHTVKIRRKRALVELIKGKKINVHEAPTRSEWEKKSIPIYFPIRKGLLGYRLLLIKSKNQYIYNNIESIDELKQLKLGTGSQWSITKVLDELGFNTVKGDSYEGIFKMLNGERFDYFPRGVNEVFGELKDNQTSFPGLSIEKRLAFYIPLPSYIFVSPKFPELAKRIKLGLDLALNDGSFDKLFYKYQKENIERANLRNRKIFILNNPFLKKIPIFENKNLWYRPNSKY